MYPHRVVCAESFTAVRTFAGTVDEPVLHTAVAKNVATILEDCILEVVFANRALEHTLGIVSKRPEFQVQSLLTCIMLASSD